MKQPFKTLQGRGRAIKALDYRHGHDPARFKQAFKTSSLPFYSLNSNNNNILRKTLEI